MPQEEKDLRLKLPEDPTVGDLIKILKKFDPTADLHITRDNDDMLHTALHVGMTPYAFHTIKYVHLHIDE